MKIYKYTLRDDKKRTILWAKDCEHEFLSCKDGICIIKSGYSWDGATPKIKLFGKWIGTSDGKNDQLKYATMWHDVLTQYGISSKIYVDYLFYSDMKNVGWKYAKLYYYAVRLFGWLRWNRG